MIGYLLLAILGLSAAGYLVGQAAGRRFAAAAPSATHSLPSYHGAFVAIWVGVPALALTVAWLLVQDGMLDSLLLRSLPASLTEGASPTELELYLAEIHNVAAGRIFTEPSAAIAEAAARLGRWQTIARGAMLIAALAVMVIALLLARRRLAPRFRARHRVEQLMSVFMIACSAVAILTTAGIIVSLVSEAWAFFALVPPAEFFFGLRWEPQIAIRPDQVAGAGAFGAVPVFLGTLVIATIAMIVATPIGLLTAIYLVEYADERVRKVVKPALEILAGVPTVVYGFFAILTVAPAIRQAGAMLGIEVAPNSALAAGLVMGIMIVPFISSLSDDAIRAVPRSMRDGSLAMGATRAETVIRVLLPAALPGIMGGILLALSRTWARR